jgi:ubiquinone/menaquinone biosynthesis C-methylase UbiE
VLTGVLKCACGAIYPVIEGVPRFVEGGIEVSPEFRRKFSAELGVELKEESISQSSSAQGDSDDFDNIRKSFSQEWGIFDYDQDRTWGWTLKQRKEIFLSDVGFASETLAGKHLLDAGCGNGTMTAALSDFDLEIIGLDLNEGLGRAYQNLSKYTNRAAAHVQFVQGNLVNPPLAANTFDLVYSSGVIHHTPSSKKSFESLVRLVKPGGRLFVWVYGKRAFPVRLFFWWGRGLKSWMPLESVLRVCRRIAPAYGWATSALNALGIVQFRKRTTREITLDLFDAFSPRYNHWHTEAEVRSWFEEHGFGNIQVTGVHKQGFGMYGDKGLK